MKRGMMANPSHHPDNSGGIGGSGHGSSYSLVNPSLPWSASSLSSSSSGSSSSSQSVRRSAWQLISSYGFGWKSLFIVSILAILLVAIIMLASSVPSFLPSAERQSQQVIAGTARCPYVWHGGSPGGNIKGSCWCSSIDQYCMCTPSLAIDGIIEYNPRNTSAGDVCEDCQIVLVRRRDPPKEFYAIPGGFVNVGESTEDATIRELFEETHLSITKECLEQFRWYSEPSRDPRRHTVSVVYRCVVHSISKLKNGDDAKAVQPIYLKDVLSLSLAFDHRKILTDYMSKYHPSYVKSLPSH